jgi:C4-type Zn-finger protein
MTNPSVIICPRCRSNTASIRTTSPIAGVWTTFGCNTCFYTWRSTEPDENRDPEKYRQVFRLNPADLANLPIVPTIQVKR